MVSSISQLLESSFNLDVLPKEIERFIQDILGNRKPVSVIYYGSALWKKDLTGLLDFYVVCDSLDDWYLEKAFLIKGLNQLLPPNIEYYEKQYDHGTLRAKVAILSLSQLRNATGLKTIDTTMWARFCQPVKVVWSRGEKERQDIFRCLVRAVGTATWWAAYLGPEKGSTVDYWCNLFAHTYAAELRVESKNRPLLILEGRIPYFEDLLQAGWKALKINFVKQNNSILIVTIPCLEKIRIAKNWQLRKYLGRPLNVIRLMKAALTFTDGAKYLVWKINRHQTKVKLSLSPFQYKHPLLCAPWVFIKLYRQGVFKR